MLYRLLRILRALLQVPNRMGQTLEFSIETMKAIQLEIEKARDLDAEVIRVHELRHDFYKDDWLVLLEFFAANMEKSKQWK